MKWLENRNMSISRKPKEQSSKTSEAAIQAVIEKGGSVAKLKSETQKKNVQLRLESELINQIDEIRKRRSVSPSRHTWILEAIHEKIQEETL